MHIVVCIKSVVVEAPKGKIIRTPDKCALNPFDRPVLEIALQLKAAQGGSVTVLSMGPPSAEASLREAMAAGADRALLLCDPALAGADTLATATALCAGIGSLAPFDLVLFGTRTSDSDTGQVGPQTAVLLDLPMVSGARQIEVEANTLTVSRDLDGILETYALDMPAALTIHPSASTPRDPELGKIVEAFDEKTVESITIGQLGLEPAQVGDAGSPTRVLSMKTVTRKRTCQWIEGTSDAQADALVKKLVEAGKIG
ncbi:electron transfer flavoprotein subunit beta [Desulfosarcina widdelii]|uniref:Electron transfer flavoprotein subunit beta n=1 Tax=Desulfosarcina widdelii TaxID=947919 RepID=A0A5K7YXR1_9BACT|nr:electron transfer flavoprotein subunit beta/FixA family protein [Desulfosarcina widdelii]BBO74146.1 electron transfer flavoprotein subunit beta [Desulfosarcina widdelii]